MERSARKALRLICACVSGVTILFILFETLISAVSLLGLSHPENGLYAVNTYIIKTDAFKLSVFLLSLTSLIAYSRAEAGKEKKSSFRYAAGALFIRLIITVIAGVALFALSLFGIEGGVVDPLVPTDGYLMRMMEPLVNVVSTALTLVFSVAFICAYFATVSELISEKWLDNREETEVGE